MRQNPGTKQSHCEKVVKDIRRATRKQYSAEEKIRIVLDGLKGEDSIAELCWRHPLTSASGADTPFLNNERGSNERPSKRDACFTANPPHHQSNQMRKILSQFKPPSVPKSLTTDNLSYRRALSLQNFNLPKLRYDLFGLLSFASKRSPSN